MRIAQSGEMRLSSRYTPPRSVGTRSSVSQPQMLECAGGGSRGNGYRYFCNNTGLQGPLFIVGTKQSRSQAVVSLQAGGLGDHTSNWFRNGLGKSWGGQQLLWGRRCLSLEGVPPPRHCRWQVWEAWSQDSMSVCACAV